MTTSKSMIIIGAGIGGLATGCYAQIQHAGRPVYKRVDR